MKKEELYISIEGEEYLAAAGEGYMIIEFLEEEIAGNLGSTKDYRKAKVIDLGQDPKRGEVKYPYRIDDIVLIPVSEKALRKIDIKDKVYHIMYIPLNVLVYARKVNN